MPSTDMLTLRLESKTNKRLGQLARSLDRSRSWLVAEAIEKYLDDNRWQVEAIEEGVRDADAGLLVPHGDVEKWVKSWRTKKPLRKPR